MASNSNTDPQISYTKASRAELARDYDEAFRLYIKAAEGFLHLSRGNVDDTRKAQWKKEAGKALERAERIKSVKGRDGLRGVEVDIWSDEEQAYVLRKSSIMNDLPIPLWSDPETPSISQSVNVQPSLSPAQIARSATWRVPSPALRMEGTETVIEPQDIVQHVVSDCSVCAAVSVCVARERRFQSKKGTTSCIQRSVKVIPDLISLSPAAHDICTANDNRRHDLKVFFNGAWRRLTFDCKLPMDSSSTILGMCVRSSGRSDNAPLALWPSLVEKAYMKLMGGYNFPGSNSSIDLHALTGWIPEHIGIKSPTFFREKTWARIFHGHSEGHCVLTLGTDTKVDTDLIFESWGRRLLKEHNYAVVDIKEVDGVRLLTVLDSRIERGLLEVGNSHLESARPGPSSTLEFSWDEICNLFEGIYVNWDPGLFQHRLEFHGIWKAKNAEDKELSSNRHLRLIIEPCGNSHDIWVLLTRHQVASGRRSEYIALHTHDYEDRQMDATKITAKATYTNSTHVLARTTIYEGCEALSIVASYDGPFEEVGYTIAVYSCSSISWDKFISKVPFTQKEEGNLTSKTGGGNCSYPTYMVNPQYHLRIYPEKGQAGSDGLRSELKANITLTCQASREIPLNVTVVWSQGERIIELARNEIAASSGVYSYGFVRATETLPAGDYTVIVSAFEPQHTGPFTLRVESSHHFEIKPIPQEGTGTYHKIIRGAWDAQTAAGGPDFKRYLHNPIYEVELSSVTQLKVRLQLLQHTSISLNLTLFHISSDLNSIGKHIATSGPYSDTISGVVTPQISLNPGKYLLVPSTYHPAMQVGFRLLAYCSTANVKITLRAPRT